MAKTQTTKPKTKATNRKFKTPEYKSFRLHKRIKVPGGKLPSVWKIMKKAWRQLTVQKRPFIVITLIYGLLILLFVRGLSGGLNAYELKENLNLLFEGQSGAWASSAAVFGVLLGSASATQGELASLYQTIILIIVSLAYIWALRQTQSNAKLRISAKEAFYKGCAPVIQFTLVLLAITLQLLPLALANLLYSMVIGGGFAATPIEQGIWYVLIFMLFLWTFYMITSSIFALYIVTLPDAKPMQALRAARDLVRHRRWMVMRKVLVLPVVLVLFLAVITLPSLVYIPQFAEWIFFVSSMLLLPALHSYMYALYRELL